MYRLGEDVLQALLREAEFDVLYWSIGHGNANHVVKILLKVCRGVGNVVDVDGFNLINTV